MSLLNRLTEVPTPRPGELRLTEELGPRGRRRVLASTVAAAALLVALVVWAVAKLRAPTRYSPDGQFDGRLWQPFTRWTTWRFYLIGVRSTLSAAGIALVAAVTIGLLMAVLRHRGERRARVLAATYVEVFRACALILLIYTPFAVWNVAPFTSVVIGLTLYYSTTIAEVVRSSLRSLPNGQEEAALAIGLTKWQCLRHVLLPQGLRAALPNVVGQSASLLKDTSLGFVVTYRELLTNSQNIGKEFDNYLPALLVGAAMYFLMILALTSLATSLQRQRRGQ